MPSSGEELDLTVEACLETLGSEGTSAAGQKIRLAAREVRSVLYSDGDISMCKSGAKPG